MRNSFKNALKSSWLIIKLVIPIYILADLLLYYNLLSKILFIFEPITSLLHLPQEAALAIVSGMFLNLYAAISFAAPLGLSANEWTILAIFLGVCHSLLVESAVMKKLGISNAFSYTLRVGGGLIIAYSSTFLISDNSSKSVVKEITKKDFDSIYELLLNSLTNATLLALKIIAIIVILIFIMDFIKSKIKQKNVSFSFAMGAGLLLGITYGAGILINEAKNMSKKELLFIATFLSICHSVIEDTLLFVIYGANFGVIVAIRFVWAILIAFFVVKYYKGVKWIILCLKIKRYTHLKLYV